MRMLLEQEKVKVIKAEAKLQDQDFVSQKKILSLTIKVTQLMRVKSTAGFQSSNQANPKMRQTEGDEEEAYCQDDAELNVIDELD